MPAKREMHTLSISELEAKRGYFFTRIQMLQWDLDEGACHWRWDYHKWPVVELRKEAEKYKIDSSFKKPVLINAIVAERMSLLSGEIKDAEATIKKINEALQCRKVSESSRGEKPCVTV